MPASIFDTGLAVGRLHRARLVRPAGFLLERSAAELTDRLSVVQRQFKSSVDIGTPAETLATAMRSGSIGGRVLRCGNAATSPDVICDIERLPIADASIDLVVSALALQGVNDLPGLLLQIRRALKPDGLFIAAMLGGGTLRELRMALGEAEAELSGGVSPRVAPFADVRDMGGLLQRAGFALPVADSDVVTVRYDHLFALMADLRAMGATNTLVARSRKPTVRALFARAADLYSRRFGDDDGRIRATFEIICLSGWAPHESQQKPARPGSARVSLASVLGDRSAGRDPDRRS